MFKWLMPVARDIAVAALPVIAERLLAHIAARLPAVEPRQGELPLGDADKPSAL